MEWTFDNVNNIFPITHSIIEWFSNFRVYFIRGRVNKLVSASLRKHRGKNNTQNIYTHWDDISRFFVFCEILIEKEKNRLHATRSDPIHTAGRGEGKIAKIAREKYKKKAWSRRAFSYKPITLFSFIARGSKRNYVLRLSGKILPLLLQAAVQLYYKSDLLSALCILGLSLTALFIELLRRFRP